MNKPIEFSTCLLGGFMGIGMFAVIVYACLSGMAFEKKFDEKTTEANLKYEKAKAVYEESTRLFYQMDDEASQARLAIEALTARLLALKEKPCGYLGEESQGQGVGKKRGGWWRFGL